MPVSRFVSRLLFLMAALVVCSPSVNAQPAPLWGLDAYIEAAMADWEQPGLAVAVVKDDQIIYERGFGVARLGSTEAVDEHTLFAIASTSKGFTAAALGMLVDEGKVHWDDSPHQHLPGFRVADPYVSQEMTIRDMLAHRTGVARHDNVWIAAPFDRSELVRRARHLRQAAGFRSSYHYNNHMYVAAGEIVGAASGSTWDSFVQTRIFWPLGMMRSTTRSAIVEIRGNVASPHMRIDGVVTPVRRRNYDALGPAGSIFSSAHDMAQWVRLHLGNGVFEGRRMISDSVMAEMHRPQNPISIGGRTRRMFPDRTYFAYGLGWRLHDYAGRDVVQHTGTVNFMKTQIGMIPSEGIGVVVIGNLTTSSLQTALMYRIFDALLGRQARDWSKEYLATARYSSGSSLPPRTAGTRLSLPLQAYAGTYADSLYGDIRISFDDETDGLVLYYSPDYVADLEHWHNDTFLVRWRRTGFGTTLATFRVNSRGEILSMNLDGYSRFSRVVSEVMEPLAAP